MAKSKRRLSEAQAFLVIARLWDQPESDRDSQDRLFFFVRPYQQSLMTRYACKRVLGVCGCVLALFNDDRITWECFNSMRDAVRRRNHRQVTGYYWPASLLGAEKRAAMCRELAEEAKARRKKKGRGK